MRFKLFSRLGFAAAACLTTMSGVALAKEKKERSLGPCRAKSCRGGVCEETSCGIYNAMKESEKSKGVTGKIKSCTGWRLNQDINRSLKTWLNSDSHKNWAGLEIEWVQGHNPELHVNGEKVDLNGHDENQMRQLLEEKGFEEL